MVVVVDVVVAVSRSAVKITWNFIQRNPSCRIESQVIINHLYTSFTKGLSSCTGPPWYVCLGGGWKCLVLRSASVPSRVRSLQSLMVYMGWDPVGRSRLVHLSSVERSALAGTVVTLLRSCPITGPSFDCVFNLSSISTQFFSEALASSPSSFLFVSTEFEFKRILSDEIFQFFMELWDWPVGFKIKNHPFFLEVSR